MYGSTYNGHPVALASAYATIKYMIEKRIIEHAAAMESHMQVWPSAGNDSTDALIISTKGRANLYGRTVGKKRGGGVSRGFHWLIFRSRCSWHILSLFF